MGDAAAREAAAAGPCGQDPRAVGSEGSGASAGLYLVTDRLAWQPPLTPRTPSGARGTEQRLSCSPCPARGHKADPLPVLLPPYGAHGAGQSRAARPQPTAAPRAPPASPRAGPSCAPAPGEGSGSLRAAAPGASVPRDPAEGTGPLPAGGSRAVGRWEHAAAPSGAPAARRTRSPPSSPGPGTDRRGSSCCGTPAPRGAPPRVPHPPVSGRRSPPAPPPLSRLTGRTR